MLQQINLVRVVHLLNKKYVFKYADEDDNKFMNISDKVAEDISNIYNNTHTDHTNLIYIPYDMDWLVNKIVKNVAERLMRISNVTIDFDKTDEYNNLMIDITESKLQSSNVHNIKIHLFVTDKYDGKHKLQYIFEITNMRLNEISHTIDRNSSPDCGSIHLNTVYFYAKIKTYSKNMFDSENAETNIRSVVCNGAIPKNISLENCENDRIFDVIVQCISDKLCDLICHDCTSTMRKSYVKPKIISKESIKL